jgi:hypothetical protein
MVRRAMLAAGVALLALPAGASACSIALMTPREYVKRASLVVYGRVTFVGGLGPGELGHGDRRYRLVVRVQRVFKGHAGPRIRLEGHTNESSCGVAPPKVGRHLGILVYERHQPYTFGLGSEISLADLHRATRRRHRAAT